MFFLHLKRLPGFGSVAFLVEYQENEYGQSDKAIIILLGILERGCWLY